MGLFEPPTYDEHKPRGGFPPYWEKRLRAAQERFTRACESLERVRELSARVPKVQINVGGGGRAAG